MTWLINLQTILMNTDNPPDMLSNKVTEIQSEKSDRSMTEEQQAAASGLYHRARFRFHQKVDKVFLLLLCVQWPIAVGLAIFMTPYTWAGPASAVHPHVYASVVIGGLATLFPAWLVWKHSGEVLTRHVVAASALIFTALFIHLSGGRDEAHFHVFIMLAFCALYFDWRVLITAMIVAVLDHALRGVVYPMSVFGVLESPWFQIIRHAGWVAFEGSVLIYAAVLIDKDKRKASEHLAISQFREVQINNLLKQNEQVSAEREERELEARKLAEENRISEVKLREAAEASTRREKEAAESQRRQVDALLESVNQAVSGDLNARITVKGDDAIGQMGLGLERLLNALSANFSEIGANAQTLTSAANELMSTSRVLGQDAIETSAQVERVSGSANRINSGVQSTASSTEQMNLAIREVSRCASEAVTVGQDAVTLADQANTTVQQLGESSSGIGNVLKVITSIAEQTNLLALNATIEAARAGDAGKGFAVVANEVKDLAKETAKATDEISSRIAAIQADAGNAGDVIAQIADIIQQIDGYQTTVAAAVEEQTSTTREISNNLAASAEGSAEISGHIADIAARTDSAKASSQQVQRSAESLGDIAARLQNLLDVYSATGTGAPQLSMVKNG